MTCETCGKHGASITGIALSECSSSSCADSYWLCSWACVQDFAACQRGREIIAAKTAQTPERKAGKAS